ncbi:hypothetical protein B0O99DRAFT_678439 [Bisporella sp. PMI_857]|nr:hypothetical protein B0O99DRAFT_678439 [Bisporella sp. PMI_857]
MHFLSTLVATSLIVSGVLAAPLQSAEEAGFGFDASNLVPENFTASDGQVYEIWVDSSFLHPNVTENNEPPSSRQRQTGPADPPAPASKYPPSWEERSTDQNKCRHSSFVGDTGPHAPTTGRCRAIQEWARTNKGFWAIGWKSITPGKYRALLASRKSGTTQCLFGVSHQAWEVRIGNSDIYDLVRDSLTKFEQNFNGVWRVRSWGSADCDGDLVQNGSAELKWWMSETFS